MTLTIQQREQIGNDALKRAGLHTKFKIIHMEGQGLQAADADAFGLYVMGAQGFPGPYPTTVGSIIQCLDAAGVSKKGK